MNTGRQTHGPDGQSWNRLLRPGSVSRYDLVLAVIPVAFLLTAVASGLLGVTMRTALAVGALLGAAVVTDALFLNPPTGGGRRN
ncbi:hypothetical protein [Haloarcula laminariae]|uniref:hypothetical protein n=1 Tax=Haloarcula laminariae TaxID=2961577 RepID=UPI0021C57C83|nr:hypothetical protein [Halomicroarcula laminariae]